MFQISSQIIATWYQMGWISRAHRATDYSVSEIM